LGEKVGIENLYKRGVPEGGLTKLLTCVEGNELKFVLIYTKKTGTLS